jgi:hypothetical protein
MYALIDRTYAVPGSTQFDPEVRNRCDVMPGNRQIVRAFLHTVRTEVEMFYPQGNSYPQASFGTQGNFNPQAGFGAQGNFNPQAGLGPQGSYGPNGSQGNPTPFANTPYGYPQQSLGFAQGLSQSPNWQNPAQQQAASQHALQQILAHQQAAQQLAIQHLSAINGFNGLSNGGAQFAGAWSQQQANQGQVNPALQPQQQPHHHLLQQLAQYHYLVAQQLAQLAAQQAVQNSGNPYAGQFISGQLGQLGANFVPGITMH